MPVTCFHNVLLRAVKLLLTIRNTWDFYRKTMAPHATTDDETAAVMAGLTTNEQGQDNSNRSLPFTSPCLSYWHRTTRAWPHLDENHAQPVPSQVKYCIIGSGLSGALTAWELVESGVEGSDILILEAREAVSGASGRNAGHVRPGTTIKSKIFKTRLC